MGDTAAALGGAGLLKLTVALWRAPVAALWPARPESRGGFGRLCRRCRSTWSMIACPLQQCPFGYGRASPPVFQVMSKTPGLPGNTMTGKARAGARARCHGAKVAAPLAILDGAISVYNTVTDDKLSTRDKVRG